jgi:hypothetical protein
LRVGINLVLNKRIKMSEDLGFWEKYSGNINVDNYRAPGFLGETGPRAQLLKYIISIGRESWLDVCKEDGALGVTAEMYGNRLVSRDLVDSIVEIDWLTKTLGPDQCSNILDIGAGYGRLAHRMHQLYPEKKVHNTDMIDVALQSCKKYMAFRNVPAPVFHGKDLPDDIQFDLAINIHSFPELKRDQVNWWLDWLVAHKVPRLFIIPHMLEDQHDQMLLLHDGKSFKPDILAHGYEVEHHWVGPDFWKRYFYIFKNTAFIKE